MTREAIGHPYALHEAYEAAHAVPAFTRKANSTDALIDFIWVRWAKGLVCAQCVLAGGRVWRVEKGQVKRQVHAQYVCYKAAEASVEIWGWLTVPPPLEFPAPASCRARRSNPPYRCCFHCLTTSFPRHSPPACLPPAGTWRWLL